jgi:thiamine biosynthesis lipoprotein
VKSFLFTVISLLFVSACHYSNLQSQQIYELDASKSLMGTEFTITANSSDIDKCKKAMYYALKEVERIDRILGLEHDSSEVNKINSSAGLKPVKVSAETFDIIKRSIEYSKKYDGIFDVTIGPISDIWGFNTNPPLKDNPDKSIVDSLIKFVNYNKIILNEQDTSVFLQEAPMRLDLGGIGKGYAIDRAVYIMKQNGMNSFLISGGGDIYVCGYKFENQKWSVGIKHPREDEKLIGKIEAVDEAIGTSGDYERYRIIDGIRYHHIFDIKTGFPSLSSQSATSIAPTAEEAVVLSKYIFILGYEKFNSIKDTKGIEGLVIDAEGNVRYDTNFAKKYGLVLF